MKAPRIRRFRVLLILAGLAAVPLSSLAAHGDDGFTQGYPWTGERGVTRSVSDIMVEQARHEANTFGIPDGLLELGEQALEGEGWRTPAGFATRTANPRSPAVARFPAGPAQGDPGGPAGPGVPVPLGDPPQPDAPQTLGTSFLATQSSDSGYVPPDTSGAVGPTQYVAIVNGRIRTFAKSTGVADGALNASTDTFFSSVRNSSGTSDPRVRFDRQSGRWILVMINVSTPNRVMIATSSGATISSSSSFTFFFFRQDQVTPAGSSSCLADYPTLGVDPQALYIGVNQFCPSFSNTDLFVVRKSSVLSGGPIVATAFRGLVSTSCSGSTGGPYTPQGVDNTASSVTEGYVIGVDYCQSGRLAMRRITDPGGTPAISANIFVTVPTMSAPRTTPANGSTRPLDALDERLFMAQLRGDRLWTAHNINVDASGVASGTSNRNAARWYELQNVAPSQTPALRQSGTLFDSAASNPRMYWIPAIQVSGQGHVAMGFSTAGTSFKADAATAGRLAGDSLGTMQAVTMLTSTSSSYNAQTSGTQRWGDYSYVSIDPDDDMTMWATEEYCNATNSWGTRVVKLIAPAPATPSSVTPSNLAAGVASTNVTITGSVVSGSGFFDPGSGFANRLAAAFSGGVTVNSVTYVDPTTVTANVSTVGASSGAKDVTITNPDGQARTGSALLTVGGAPAATKLGFTTAPQNLAAGVTSGTITVQAQDAGGAGVNVAAPVTVSLSSSSAAGIFRDDTDSSTITSVTIGAGTSSASFRYRDTLAGTPAITASAAGLTAAQQTETVNAAAASRLVYTTSAQTLTAGTSSSPVTVARRDAFDNPVTAGSTVAALSSSSAGGSFRDSGDSTTITSVTIGAGTSTASFRYRDTLAGSPAITSSSSGLTAAQQTETVNAASAAKLLFTTTAQTVTAGATSADMTVQRQDTFGNVVTSGSNLVSLATTSGAGSFRDAGGATITSVTIIPSSSTATFRYVDTIAGSPSVTASSAGLISVSQTETIVAAAASKLVFTTAPQTLTAGVSSGTITLQRRDVFDNPVTSGSTAVALASDSGAGSFRNPADTATITSLTIGSGSSGGSFRYRDTAAGSPSITSSSSGLTAAAQTETVNAAAAAKLAFTTAPQTLTAGVSSEPVGLERRDAFDNPATSGTTVAALATDSGGGGFRDAAGATTITSVAIGDGSSSVAFRYRDTAAGSPSIAASASGLSLATQTETVQAATASALVYTNAPLTVTAGAISDALTVERRDAFGNVVSSGAATVALATDSTGGEFRDAAGGTTVVTSVAIPDGSSTASFRYRDTLTGTPHLTATAAGLTPAEQTETIDPARTSDLFFTTAAQTLTAGATSSPVTVERRDELGNPATAGALSVALTTSSAGGEFRDASGLVVVTGVTIADGASGATFTYRDTVAGSPAITASAGGLNAAVQAESIVPGAAAVLSLSLTPDTIVADGSSSSYASAHLTDSFGNGRPSETISISTSGDATVPATMTSSGGGLYLAHLIASTTAGDQTITALAESLNASATLREVAGAATLVTLSANPAVVNATPGSGNAATLAARVTDAYGNPVEGVVVSFSFSHVESGLQIGIIDPSVGANAMTGADGEALVTYTAGFLPGDDTVRATIPGGSSGDTTIHVRPAVCFLGALPLVC